MPPAAAPMDTDPRPMAAITRPRMPLGTVSASRAPMAGLKKAAATAITQRIARTYPKEAANRYRGITADASNAAMMNGARPKRSVRNPAGMVVRFRRPVSTSRISPHCEALSPMWVRAYTTQKGLAAPLARKHRMITTDTARRDGGKPRSSAGMPV